MKRLMSFVAAALLLPAAVSAADGRCTLPGELISEDASGDDQLAPTGAGFADILSLHMAEPAGIPGMLVFTFRMTDLAVMPPDMVWMIRFSTDVPPDNGDEGYFVAMLTRPDAAARFVHGTVTNVGGTNLRAFNPAGALDSRSSFNADGTMTLVLDKSEVPGLKVGQAVFGMVPLTHRITPTDGTQPFAYGFVSVGGALLAMDDAPDGFYEVAGSETCSESKSLIASVGALAPATLLMLLLVPALRHARVRATRQTF